MFWCKNEFVKYTSRVWTNGKLKFTKTHIEVRGGLAVFRQKLLKVLKGDHTSGGVFDNHRNT